MKIKKHFTYNSNRQIFRIIISDSDKLIIESRDMNSKDVYFNCYELVKGKKIFTDYQFDEKSWIGIEAEYKNIIYFHKYDKPDMPVHRGVIAFDIETQKILWTNENLSFLFVHENLVYCYKQGFEERFFYSLDSFTGNFVEDLGNNYQTVNSIREQSNSEKDWSVYNYPEQLSAADEIASSIIKKFIKTDDVVGNIEYCKTEDLLFFNYHDKASKDTYNNNFIAVDLNSKKSIFEKVLNSNTTALYTDSFFIYKNFLFLLKEKNEVNIFMLEQP